MFTRFWGLVPNIYLGSECLESILKNVLQCSWVWKSEKHAKCGAPKGEPAALNQSLKTSTVVYQKTQRKHRRRPSQSQSFSPVMWPDMLAFPLTLTTFFRAHGMDKELKESWRLHRRSTTSHLLPWFLWSWPWERWFLSNTQPQLKILVPSLRKSSETQTLTTTTK